MKEEQQRVIDECNVALERVGLVIETVVEIGNPIPPRK